MNTLSLLVWKGLTPGHQLSLLMLTSHMPLITMGSEEWYCGIPKKSFRAAQSKGPWLLMACLIPIEAQLPHHKPSATSSSFSMFLGAPFALLWKCMGSKWDLGGKVKSLRMSFLGVIICGQPKIEKQVRRLPVISWMSKITPESLHEKPTPKSQCCSLKAYGWFLPWWAISTALHKSRSTVAGRDNKSQPGIFIVQESRGVDQHIAEMDISAATSPPQSTHSPPGFPFAAPLPGTHI